MPTRGNDIYWADSFLTFRSVAVPHGAVINKAFVRFTAKSSGSSPMGQPNNLDDVYAMIFGNNVDNSTASTSATDANSKALTTSCVAWDNIAHWTDDTTYDSPDIACVIQEIVDRSGWTSGNDLSLYFENNYSTEAALQNITRRAYDYGTDTSKAPQLFIYWQYEEFPTGDGILVGGTAPITNGYTETPTGDEILVGGSAPVEAGFTETPTGDEVLIGGTAPVLAGFNIATSGGMLLGSTAGIHLGYNITTSGGLIIGPYPWTYRLIITIPAGTTATNLDKFPAIFTVSLDPTHMANANDWTTTDIDGNPLAHHLRRWDSETGQLSIAVKVNIDHTTDCKTVLWYGAR